jgi:queuine tRNA-ribosyltransferase
MPESVAATPRLPLAGDRDQGDEECGCAACSRFTRAYLRHLVTQQELLGLILLTDHNVRFLLDLTAGARTAIERREFSRYREAVLGRLGSGVGAIGQEVST